MLKDDLKVAFVQDAMLFQGGADKVVAAALEVFPQAPIYTLVYNPAAYRGTIFENHPIHTSFLDRLPGAHRHHRLFLPLMPLALERFDLKRYDVVVAFSYAVAHAAPTRSHQLHISYLHTPMRYAWQPRLVSQISPGASKLPFRMATILLNLFRKWDAVMASRTDYFVTNSFCTADLIQQAYQRKAEVLYPPVDTDGFRPAQSHGNYYIAVSRLIGHKRLDLVVQAFTQLGYPLVVVGEGPEETRLRAMAGPNVQFLGWQPQEHLAGWLGQAKAFVHAGEEDFGIAIAEAQAAGCPVIALKRGASPEIVSDGNNGILFPEQTVQSLVQAVQRFESMGVADPPGQIQAGAQRFSRDRFKKDFEALVMQQWVEFEQKRTVVSRWQDTVSYQQEAAGYAEEAVSYRR